MKLALNQVGALLLGAAIHKIFPHAEIEGSRADTFEFQCSFLDSERFDPSYLQLLENTMRDLSREDIQLMEMIASNASELLKHLGQNGIAKRMEKGKHVVSVARIGDFADLCDEASPCKIFTLLGFEQKKGKVRVFGAAFETDREKKEFLKKFRGYSKKESSYLAKELDLYEGDTWHPRGILLKKVLLNLWSKLLSENDYEEVSTESGQGYFETTNRKKFYCFDGTTDRVYCYRSITSLLQLLEKWVIICKLEHRWVLNCSKQSDPLKKAAEGANLVIEVQKGEGNKSSLELQIADALGRWWSGPNVCLEKNGAKASFFGDIKQFIALLIEQFEGEFPFHLAPEQVRLIPLEGVELTEVLEIFNRLNIRYLVDRSKILLKEKIHLALRVKVPYVMVFGKQEESRREMSIRAYGSSQEQKKTLDEMEILLAERKIESQ